MPVEEAWCDIVHEMCASSKEGMEGGGGVRLWW